MSQVSTQVVSRDKVKLLHQKFRRARLISNAQYLAKYPLSLEVQVIAPAISTAFPSSEKPNNYQSFRQAVHISSANQLRKQRVDSLRKAVNILDIEIDNLTLDEFLGQLSSGVVFTPNVDHLMKLQHDAEFMAAYDQADYRVCDSQVLMYAARFLGERMKGKISGSDLFPKFCEYHQHNEQIQIFLLGGAEGIPQLARDNINRRTGREIIIAAHSPSYGFEKSTEECYAIIDMINRSGANVLVVGVGAPKQEIWIAKYREFLPEIKIFLAVGAAIDFEAGNKPRSPDWMSRLGLEWLYRLITEPKRLWKRYLIDDLPFFKLLFLQKFARRRLKRS
jgi:N-acetylglucosaminyldiphosphoundecaprenol N-acetyl-beta-D-mannosaminyltransferase